MKEQIEKKAQEVYPPLEKHHGWDVNQLKRDIYKQGATDILSSIDWDEEKLSVFMAENGFGLATMKSKALIQWFKQNIQIK
jgi:hypothetical protein